MAEKKIKTFTMDYRDENGKGNAFEIRMHIDNKRFVKQYSEAQKKLDSIVMTHMIPFMPMQTATFIKVTEAMSNALAGTGTVVAAAPPFGRYLYYGKLMVDKKTKSAYARPGKEKILTGKELDFSKGNNQNAVPFWFEEAKRIYLKNWIDVAKKEAGGGK